MALKKIPIPFHSRVDSFRRQVLPLVVWLMAVVGVVELIDMRGSNQEYFGIAETQEFVLSAPVDGKVMELPAATYAQVNAGSILVIMDSEPLLAQLRTASAEVERLSAEQLAVVAELRLNEEQSVRDWEKDARRFEMDGVNIRLEMVRQRINLETSQVEASRLKLAFDRAEALVNADAQSQAVADNLDFRHQTELERIRTLEAFIAELAQQFGAAQSRSNQFLASNPGQLNTQPRLLALQRAVEVQELRLAELELARKGLVLHAPISGQIRLLSASPGQNVVLGQPLLTLTPTHNGSVVFYQPQHHLSGITVGDHVEVRRTGDSRVGEAIVMQMSPTIEELPASMWRDPAVPEYGRSTRISPVLDLGLVPGDLVRITAQRN